MIRTINETPLFNDVSRCRESQHDEGLAAKVYMRFLDLRVTALRKCERSNVYSVPLEPDQADNARSQSRTHKMVMRSTGSSLGAGWVREGCGRYCCHPSSHLPHVATVFASQMQELPVTYQLIGKRQPYDAVLRGLLRAWQSFGISGGNHRRCDYVAG